MPKCDDPAEPTRTQPAMTSVPPEYVCDAFAAENTPAPSLRSFRLPVSATDELTSVAPSATSMRSVPGSPSEVSVTVKAFSAALLPSARKSVRPLRSITESDVTLEKSSPRMSAPSASVAFANLTLAHSGDVTPAGTANTVSPTTVTAV